MSRQILITAKYLNGKKVHAGLFDPNNADMRCSPWAGDDIRALEKRFELSRRGRNIKDIKITIAKSGSLLDMHKNMTIDIMNCNYIKQYTNDILHFMKKESFTT